MKQIPFALIALLNTCTLLGNCRSDTPYLRPEPGPDFAYDFSKQFNEKRYWIEQNSRTGAWQICWQRLGIRSAFFETTTMFCFPAVEVAPPARAPEGTRCWRGDGVLLCQTEDGRIALLSHAEAK